MAAHVLPGVSAIFSARDARGAGGGETDGGAPPPMRSALCWILLPHLRRCGVNLRDVRALWRFDGAMGGARGNARNANGRRTGQAGATAMAALPFEPQPGARRGGAWFEGWFVRITDQQRRTSVAVVFGSLRLAHPPRRNGAAARRTRGRAADSDTWRQMTRGDHPFDEHILVVAYRDGAGRHATRTAYLDGPDVALQGGAQVADVTRGRGDVTRGSRVSWWSARHGKIE